MNIAMMNLCISLICPYFNLWSNLTSDIMPVTILTAIVTAAFQDLVETELCYTYVQQHLKYLFICLSIYLSNYLSIYLSIYLSVIYLQLLFYTNAEFLSHICLNCLIVSNTLLFICTLCFVFVINLFLLAYLLIQLIVMMLLWLGLRKTPL